MDVAAAHARVRQAQAESAGSRLLPNPVVDVSVGNAAVGDTNPKGLGLDQTLIFGAGVSETFELGKRGPRARAADLRLLAARRQSQSSLANAVADARLALGRAVYARERQRALAASLSAARAATAIARGRLEHQALSGVDYDRMVLDLSTLEADAARGKAEAQAALAECGAELFARCDLAGTTTADLDAGAPNARTLERRPDIAAMRLEQRAAESDARLASRRSIPDLTLRLGYTHDRFTISGDNENTLSLSLAAPIPVFDHGQHDRARALAAAGELSLLTRGTLLRARGDLAALSAKKRMLSATLQKLEADLVPRADAVLAAQEKGLAEGQLDTTDLLMARRQAIALRLQALELRYELFTTKNEIRRVYGAD